MGASLPTQCASVKWKHPNLPSTKKFKITHTPSAGKFMLVGVLGFSGSTVSPFSEAWRKYEFCIVL
jgi:hypothetical protein